MTETKGIYTANIPPQVDTTTVNYYIQATDDSSNITVSPNDAPITTYSYNVVTPTVISIMQVQTPTDSTDISPYNGQVVTVEGVVSAIFEDAIRTTVIQELVYKDVLYTAITIYDNNVDYALGDEIQVTGTVDEYNGFTELINITNSSLIGTGNIVPVTIVSTTTIATGSVDAEKYESVLIILENVTVTDTFDYGEWAVDDGSGACRVDDKAAYTYVPMIDDNLSFIAGILWYSYGDFKIEPRGDSDIVPVGINDDILTIDIPKDITLLQNYPNPFNPNTSITFNLPSKSDITLSIYNTRGELIHTLMDGNCESGYHNILWNGTDNNNRSVSSGIYFYRLESDTFNETKKMLLLK